MCVLDVLADGKEVRPPQLPIEVNTSAELEARYAMSEMARAMRRKEADARVVRIAAAYATSEAKQT